MVLIMHWVCPINFNKQLNLNNTNTIRVTFILKLPCKMSAGRLWVGGFQVLMFSCGSLTLSSQTNQATLNCSEYSILTVSICFFFIVRGVLVCLQPLLKVKKTQLLSSIRYLPTPFSFASIAVIFQLHPTKFHMLIVANQT